MGAGRIHETDDSERTQRKSAEEGDMQGRARGRLHTGSGHAFPVESQVRDNLLPASMRECRPVGKPAPALSVQRPGPPGCAGGVSERPSWVAQVGFVTQPPPHWGPSQRAKGPRAPWHD